MFFWDPTYILIFPAMLFALWAQSRVQTVFNRYSRVRARSGVSGAEGARRILDANGLDSVRIEQIPGRLQDHYDPRAKVLRL